MIKIEHLSKSFGNLEVLKDALEKVLIGTGVY